MAAGAYRIACTYHGPEFPGSTFYFSSACRFRSVLPHCRILQVKISNQRLSIGRRAFGRRWDATRHEFRKSLHITRSSKGEKSSGSSKDEGNAGDDAEERAADSETYEEEEEIREIREEIESDLIAEKAPSQQVSKGNSGFWGSWWGKVRQEIDDVAETEGQGDGVDDDGSDSEGDEEGNGVEVKQEEVVNSVEDDAPTAEPSKTGFWRRFWRREVETPDVDSETSREDELLLRDLENLQFRWKELLEPSVENVLALALTALLGLAGVQIIWQMVVVATAITLSALKYTVLAAIIVGLLIFLL